MWAIVGLIVLAAALALVAEERAGLLKPGDRAPSFDALLPDGTRVSLSDILGKKPLVLFFYPADFTAGCTKEVCAFRDRFDRIRELDVALVGVSGDDNASHAKFSSAYHLPFPLIADTDGSLRRAYGVRRLGGLVPFAKRVTYVIDRDGIVRGVFHHEIVMEQHVEGILPLLVALQARSGTGGAVTPRN